jgi:hypothetical protein
VHAVGGAGLRENWRELVRRQQTMAAADGVHVLEESRAGNVAALELSLIAGGDHANVRIVQMLREPLRGDERRRRRCRRRQRECRKRPKSEQPKHRKPPVLGHPSCRRHRTLAGCVPAVREWIEPEMFESLIVFISR